MHPLFVKLYLEAEADDLLADEERRGSANRARRSRRAVRVTTTRAQDRRPRR
jgi:hypothetical protein